MSDSVMEPPDLKNSALYRQFIEDASLIFLILNADGTICHANTFAGRQLGDHLIGRPFEEIILDFYNTFSLDQVRSPRSHPWPLNVKRRNGLPQTYQFRFTPKEDLLYAIGEPDIDELEGVRKEILSLNEELSNMGRELHKKNAQLSILNREKNQFLGMAAHDLRKPIGLVLTYSDFLIDEAGPVLDEEHRGFLGTIQKSCIFMKRLVDDFLDVSAIEAGKFEMDLYPTQIREVLNQSLCLNSLQAEKKGITLLVDTDDSLPKSLMDAPKIEQVITNLVSNAIEHTLPGTPVRICLDADQENLTFSVEDKGPGIPEDEIKKLFTPYLRTSIKKTGGEKSTGLGMVITRKIIESHGGNIWIESRLDVGTCVYFTLPIVKKIRQENQ
ncbi:MAG: PAS domain-containing sensor histidine kinase [Desulfobacterales bacterium]|nr:PAS domain-containing sensor histidine kinase [Desulfobacterales bacterium]